MRRARFCSGGLMVPLAAQIDRHRLRETDAALARALGSTVRIRRIARQPPAVPGRGRGTGWKTGPGPAAAPCRGIEGELPRATLGIQGADGWGRRIRYRGNDAFTGPAGVPTPPNTRGGLRIDDHRTAERLTVGDPEAPAAILFSCGANGRPDGENDGTGGLARRLRQSPSPRPPLRPRGAGAAPGSRTSTTFWCGCRRTCSSAGSCGREPGHDHGGRRPPRTIAFRHKERASCTQPPSRCGRPRRAPPPPSSRPSSLMAAPARCRARNTGTPVRDRPLRPQAVPSPASVPGLQSGPGGRRTRCLRPVDQHRVFNELLVVMAGRAMERFIPGAARVRARGTGSNQAAARAFGARTRPDSVSSRSPSCSWWWGSSSGRS